MTAKTAPIPQLGGDISRTDLDRFQGAIAAIDAENTLDPNTMDWQGETWPKELLHAHLVTNWLLRLNPNSTPLALIAGRGHHFKRWLYPRTDYPEGRGGYLRWRRDAQKAHAHDISELLSGLGYKSDDIDQVVALVQKINLKSDTAAQHHEDALCLVFLETQLVELTEDVGDESMVNILAKTMAKMSPLGREHASKLDLNEHSQSLFDQAVELLQTQHTPD